MHIAASEARLLYIFTQQRDGVAGLHTEYIHLIPKIIRTNTSFLQLLMLLILFWRVKPVWNPSHELDFKISSHVSHWLHYWDMRSLRHHCSIRGVILKMTILSVVGCNMKFQPDMFRFYFRWNHCRSSRRWIGVSAPWIFRRVFVGDGCSTLEISHRRWCPILLSVGLFYGLKW